MEIQGKSTQFQAGIWQIWPGISEIQRRIW
jgi:hypothetical protein